MDWLSSEGCYCDVMVAGWLVDHQSLALLLQRVWCTPLSSPWCPPRALTAPVTTLFDPCTDGVERVVGQVWGAEHQGLQMEHHPGPSHVIYLLLGVGRVYMYVCTHAPTPFFLGSAHEKTTNTHVGTSAGAMLSD